MKNQYTLNTQVGNVSLTNPILLASGTCGFGRELSSFYDLSQLGGLCSKGLTLQPRLGNLGVRVAETPSGMLNSVGLQNPGLQSFLDTELPFMSSLNTKVIVNIAGHCPEDYIAMVEALGKPEVLVDVLELNLSCPNVKEGCITIGSSPEAIYELVARLRLLTTKPLWVKLTPNVTSITQTALAAEKAGADAVVLINTVMGMAIDIKTKKPILQNNTGGLSGPAIKPIALRMISECYQALKIPIVGLGGIESATDVIEFMLAGARAVQLGTCVLVSPLKPLEILEDLKQYQQTENIPQLSSLVGQLALHH